jgi:LysM repeat protein
VGAGQALWQIAAHYEIELSQLLLINSLDDDHIIQPGDEIWIRLADGQPPPPTPTPPVSHIVREGENPWMIAARYDVDLYTVFYLNGFDENVLLHPGDEVRVRLAAGEEPPPTPTPKLHHTVREGETLWTVAALNSLTLDELLALNNISSDATIHVGDQLLIRAEPTATAEPETPPPTEAPSTPTATASPTSTNVSDTSSQALAVAFAPQSGTPTATPTPTSSPDEGEGDSILTGSLIFTLLILGGAAWLFSRGRL